MKPPEDISQFPEVLSVQKAGSEEYNTISSTRMRYYGSFFEGYRPTMDEDLSGQFFPCESISPYDGRITVSSYVNNPGHDSHGWSEPVELRVHDNYSQQSNLFPYVKGTYWYQDQSPNDVVQGATGYIFQMNNMDFQCGSSWIGTRPSLSNYRFISSTTNEPDEDDDFEWTSMSCYSYNNGTVPEDIYVKTYNIYDRDNQGTFISAQEISVDNRFGVKWMYRFSNYG